MIRTVAVLVLMTLVAAGCGDDNPVTELRLSLEVVPAQGDDPMIIRAHVRNVGNTRIVSEAACSLVHFWVSDADGIPVATQNPCVAALVDCAQLLLELEPLQEYEQDFLFRGVVYELHVEEQEPGVGVFQCEETPLAPGLYTISAAVGYRAGTMLPEEGLVARAEIALDWNP